MLLLSVIMLNVSYAECHNQLCRYAECQYAECRDATQMSIIIRVLLPRATVNIIPVQSKVTYIDLLRC